MKVCPGKKGKESLNQRNGFGVWMRGKWEEAEVLKVDELKYLRSTI